MQLTFLAVLLCASQFALFGHRATALISPPSLPQGDGPPACKECPSGNCTLIKGKTPKTLVRTTNNPEVKIYESGKDHISIHAGTHTDQDGSKHITVDVSSDPLATGKPCVVVGITDDKGSEKYAILEVSSMGKQCEKVFEFNIDGVKAVRWWQLDEGQCPK